MYSRQSNIFQNPPKTEIHEWKGGLVFQFTYKPDRRMDETDGIPSPSQMLHAAPYEHLRQFTSSSNNSRVIYSNESLFESMKLHFAHPSLIGREKMKATETFNVNTKNPLNTV